jgi:hypothetical protein
MILGGGCKNVCVDIFDDDANPIFMSVCLARATLSKRGKKHLSNILRLLCPIEAEGEAHRLNK